MSSLLPLFKWFDNTWVSAAIRDSNWLFPAIEAVHIVALTLLFGAILIVNLRLLGLALQAKPVSKVAREVAPWILCSLVIILASGLMLFASEAMKSYSSVPFQVKMVFLFAAIVFHFTVHRRVTAADAAGVSPPWGRFAAAISLILWLGVGIGGRAIGFL